MARNYDTTAVHSHRFEMRLTPEERKQWEKAARRDGFMNIAEWVRVNMKKVALGT